MFRVPLSNEPPLLEPERVLRLLADARAAADDPELWISDDAEELTYALAGDAVLLALEVAIDTGDPRLLAAAIDGVEQWGQGVDDIELPELAFALTAQELLPHAHEITNRVRECARSRSPFLRQATAVALAPRALRSMRGEGDDADAEAMRIVLALTKDGVGEVRKAARDALGGIAPPAWAAFFDRDPLAARSAAEAARLRGPLDRAAGLLDAFDGRDARPVADAVAELPDELARPLLDAFVRNKRAFAADGGDELFARWARLDPDGSTILAWLERADSGSAHRDVGACIGEALAARPPEEAVAIAQKVAAIVARSEPRNHMLRLELADHILRAAWPESADPTPLLELALGAPLAEASAPDPEPPPVHFHIPRSILLGVALAPRPAFALVIDPLVGALIAGFPGRFARARDEVRKRLLDVADPRLRAHAEELVRESEGEDAAWGLRYLIAAGHDPALDPEPDAILRAAVGDPRLRAAMIEDHALSTRARELLRAELAGRGLTPHEAIELGHRLVVVGRVSLRAEEWAAVRRARELAVDVVDRAVAALVLPAALADWTAEDHSFLEGLVERDGHVERVADLVALTIGQRACVELAPLAERLLERAPQGSQQDARRALADCRGGKG